jgi:CspA family cold shock protein
MAKPEVGTVKWFSDRMGYGFIIPEDGSKDVIVHYSAIISDEPRRSLKDGDVVEFEVVATKKGLAAKWAEVVLERSARRA